MSFTIDHPDKISAPYSIHIPILSSFKPTQSFQTTDTFTVQPDVSDRFKGAELASFSFNVPTANAKSVSVARLFEEPT
mgnify:CR=1 FL=1